MNYDVRCYYENGSIFPHWERNISAERVCELFMKGLILRSTITGYLKIKPV